MQIPIGRTLQRQEELPYLTPYRNTCENSLKEWEDLERMK